MRDIYHDELDQVGTALLDMTNRVALAMSRATQALLDADLSSAESVVTDDAQVDALRADLESRTFLLMAQQQPVAGDLALHIAKIARMRYPEIAVPAQVRDVIDQMGAVAQSLVAKVAEVIDGRDVALAQAIEIEDDSMDALRRKLFLILLSDSWTEGTETAIDMTLIGRFYERYADHAVSVARRFVFIVTGTMPERIASIV
jgi:phosphate transport system protein